MAFGFSTNLTLSSLYTLAVKLRKAKINHKTAAITPLSLATAPVPYKYQLQLYFNTNLINRLTSLSRRLMLASTQT